MQPHGICFHVPLALFFSYNVSILILISSFSSDYFDEIEHVLFFENFIKLIWSNKNISSFALYIVKSNEFDQINLVVYLRLYKCFSPFVGKHLYQSVSFDKCTDTLTLSLFKKRFRHWCFPDSYLKFLIITFFKSIVTRKKHCYKKRGSDTYRKHHYATFYLTSLRFQHRL